jgi:hypothetical protein
MTGFWACLSANGKEAERVASCLRMDPTKSLRVASRRSPPPSRSLTLSVTTGCRVALLIQQKPNLESHDLSLRRSSRVDDCLVARISRGGQHAQLGHRLDGHHRWSRGPCLVEAKAHTTELKAEGKADYSRDGDEDALRRRAENEARIDAACRGASEQLDRVLRGWNLSIASHYQLCNRFAWAWKLASLGVPVVLVYLGFLHADEMRHRGEPFTDARHWQTVLRNHSWGIVPDSVWDEPILINCTPLHALIRSTEIALLPQAST